MTPAAVRRVRPRITLSIAISGLVVLASVTIVLLYAWQTWASWNAQQRVLIRETTNLAQSLSEQTASSFEVTTSVLERMYFWAAARGVAPPQRALLRDLLRVRTPSMRAIRTLAFFDRNALPVVRSAAPRDAREIPGARAAWTYHSMHATLQARLGDPAFDQSARVWTITESRRFNDRAGRFAGIVLATVSLAPLARLVLPVDVGRDGVIGVVLIDSGMFVVRNAHNRQFFGRPVTDSVLLTRLRSAPAGQFTHRSSFDGVTRHIAYREVSTFRLAVEVGISVDEAFASWRTISIVGFAGVCSVIGLIASLMRFLLREIRRNAESQALLAEFALRDGLTSLANRRQFDITIERECRQADRDGTELSLLMIDADEFKSYNDRYGHQVGDDVLRIVAECIRENSVRPSDLAARYGGEEFAVVLPRTPLSGAQTIAERIRTAVAARDLVHADSTFGRVTVSIGIALRIPGHLAPSAELVRSADEALYAAKRNGRNRIESAPDARSAG